MPHPVCSKIKHRVPDSISVPPNFSGLDLAGRSLSSLSGDFGSVGEDEFGRRPSIDRSQTTEVYANKCSPKPGSSGRLLSVRMNHANQASGPKRSQSDSQLATVQDTKITFNRLLRRSRSNLSSTSSKYTRSSKSSSVGKSSKSSPGSSSTNIRRWTNSNWKRSGGTNLAHLIPENSTSLAFFQYGSAPMTCRMRFLIFCSLSVVAATINIALSSVGSIGYGAHVYTFFMRFSNLAPLLLMVACLLVFILHVLDWWEWKQHRQAKASMGIIAFYVVISAGASMTVFFPIMPVIIAMLHPPLMIVFLRSTSARSCRSADFHHVVGITSLLIACSIIFLWCLNITVNHSPWGDETERTLLETLLELVEDYGLTDYKTCELDAGSSANFTNEDDPCSKLKLIAVLLWFSPLLESMLFLFIAVFSAFRRWLFSKHEMYQLAIVVQILMCFLASLSCAFWVSLSMSGINKEMSLSILALVGLACFGILVWMYHSLEWSNICLVVMEHDYLEILIPLVVSDEFKGGVLSIVAFPVIAFLALEASARMCQRILRIPGPHPFFTRRALSVVKTVEEWNWNTVLEQTFWWDAFFVGVWVICSEFDIAVMVWLQDTLKNTGILHFFLFFYIGMAVLFTLTPIPGIPIYVCCGFAFAIKLNGGLHSILFAVLMASMLKVNAVAVQYLIFGKSLGRSAKLQHSFGLHRAWIRALREMLSPRGTYVAKVLIVCGGPDLPTAILAGMFNVPWWQMIYSLLPMYGIILPSILAGFLMAEDALVTLSRAIIAIMTVVQGIIMALACLAILYFISVQGQELDRFSDNSSLEGLFILAQEKAEEEKLSSLVSEWQALSELCKALLVVATLLETSCCWVFFFLSSECFATANISSSFKAPMQDGGLDGDLWNVVTPFGFAVLSCAAFGVVIICLYYIALRRRTRSVLSSALVLSAQHHDARGRLSPVTLISNSPSSNGESAWSVTSSNETVIVEPLLIQSLVFKGTPAVAEQGKFE